MVSGNPGGNPLTNVIQGAGIGFDAAEPHNRIGGVWYTDAPGGFPSDYVAVHAGPEHLWFELGLDDTLAEISYWGYSTGNANGVKGFNVSFATEAEGGLSHAEEGPEHHVARNRRVAARARQRRVDDQQIQSRAY